MASPKSSLISIQTRSGENAAKRNLKLFAEDSVWRKSPLISVCITAQAVTIAYILLLKSIQIVHHIVGTWNALNYELLVKSATLLPSIFYRNFYVITNWILPESHCVEEETVLLEYASLLFVVSLPHFRPFQPLIFLVSPFDTRSTNPPFITYWRSYFWDPIIYFISFA